MKRKARIPKELRDITRRLVEHLEDVKAVVLFGSRARGDWLPWSDYDLLVIAGYSEPYLERIKKILDLLADTKLPVEPHPYTPREALEMLHQGNPIIVDAIEEGIPLHKTTWYDKLLEEYQELRRRGLKRTKTTIKLPRGPRQT